jgi:hypothetical protein
LMFVCLGCSAAICFFKNEAPFQGDHTSVSSISAIEQHYDYAPASQPTTPYL